MGVSQLDRERPIDDWSFSDVTDLVLEWTIDEVGSTMETEQISGSSKTNDNDTFGDAEQHHAARCHKPLRASLPAERAGARQRFDAGNHSGSAESCICQFFKIGCRQYGRAFFHETRFDIDVDGTMIRISSLLMLLALCLVTQSGSADLIGYWSADSTGGAGFILPNDQSDDSLDGQLVEVGYSSDGFGPNNMFKSTIGSNFGNISFGNVLPTGRNETDILADLSVSGSLEGGGGLGDVDLVMLPEPPTSMLLFLGLAGVFPSRRRR